MRVILFLLLFTSFLFSNTNINLKLKWKHQFQFAGFYMALEKGYYKSNNLNVTFDELNKNNPIDDVLNENLTFGLADSTIIHEKMTGSEITALAAIFQESPLVLISLKNRGINSPSDLKGKIIEIPKLSEKKSPVYTVLKSFGVEYIEKDTTFKVDDLINNKTDAISGYITDKPYQLSKIGYETTIINPKDYGFDFYGDILYTSNNTLKNHPKEVKAFVDASILGWKYAFENIDETIDLILEKYNTQNMNKDELLYEAKITKKLVGDLQNFGKLDINKIKNIASVYSVLIPGYHDLNQLNDFIYSDNKLIQTNKNTFMLNEKEQDFFEKNQTFNICTNKSFYPLSGYENGNVIGVMGEFYKYLGDNLNVKFNAIEFESKEKLQEYVSKGVCDIYDLMHKNQYLNSDFELSRILEVSSFISLGGSKFIDKNNISDVTFYTKYQEHIDLIKQLYPGINIKYEPNESKISRLLSNTSNNQYITTTSESKFFLKKYEKLDFTSNYFFNDIKHELQFGILKSKPELVSAINRFIDFKGASSISSLIKSYINFTESKVFNSGNKVVLSIDEIKKFENKRFEIYVNNWEPFTYLDNNGRFSGFAVNYFNELFKPYKLNYKYIFTNNFQEALEKSKNNPNSILISTTKTNLKSEFGSFSTPYNKFNIALVTNKKQSYTYDFETLNGKKIAVGKNYSSYEILKDKYPKIDFVFVNNTLEALDLVLKGEVYGAVDILPVMNNLLFKHSINDLKVSGLSKEYFNLEIMVNKANDEFIDVINKLIVNFDKTKLKELENLYLNTSKIEKIDPTFLYIAIIILLVVVSFLIVIQYISNKNKKMITIENKKLEKANEKISFLNEELNNINKTLEDKIKNAVDENTKQQAILLHQNRLAQLGEMVSMIAHQWRQPLSALSIWISNIGFIARDEKIDRDEILKIEAKIKDIIIHLSSTIDEFKNYYNTNSKKVDFYLKASIEQSLNVVDNYLISKKVVMNVDISEDIKLHTFDNLLRQVIVALVTNATDAMVNEKNKKIFIVTNIDDENIEILVKDCGPGIPENLSEKIFEPYFTTKSDLNGTGLGLYMSKMIIEKSFGGTLTFETSNKGTCFSVKFPIKENS